MLSLIFRRAQATVDNAIGQAVNRAIIAIPFIIALGFGTAALTLRLIAVYGQETAYMMIAGGFALIGIIAAAALLPGKPEPLAAQSDAEQLVPGDMDAASTQANNADVDRELVAAALTSVAPMALPALLRLVIRNLPILLALAAALYVFTRGEETEGEGTEAKAQV